MDRERFDSLTRVFAVSRSRRAALGSLAAALGVFSESRLTGTTIGKSEREQRKDARRRNRQRANGNSRNNPTSKGKRKRHGDNQAKRKGNNRGSGRNVRPRRDRAQVQLEAIPAGCCGGGNCTPGTGKNLSNCCYEDQHLAGKTFKGSNLTNANFRGATLTNAKFQSSNLTRACLVDADITGANFKNANQSAVIRCRTQIGPNSYDNSGCNSPTACCQTCVPVGDSGCDIGGGCCGGAVCTTSGVCECPQDRPHLCSDGTCRECCTTDHCDDGATCVGNLCTSPTPPETPTPPTATPPTPNPTATPPTATPPAATVIPAPTPPAPTFVVVTPQVPGPD